MQNQRRTPKKPVQASRNRKPTRSSIDKTNHRKVILIAVVILLVFLLIGVGNVSAWVWLLLASHFWRGMYLNEQPKKHHKEIELQKKETIIRLPKRVEKTQEPEKQKDVVLSKLEQQKQDRIANCIYDLVVIDFETTGLNSNFLKGRMDEILSVAIIDQNGNTLLSTLCSTSDRKTWKKAEEIHGITPAMVREKPTFSEILPEVKEILYKAKKVIAYNIPFEMGFLWSYDTINDFPGGTKIREMLDWGEDPMLMYSAYIGNERWQKLTTAAKHFKYSFKEHDALEDAKATLHVYNALSKYVATYDNKEYILKYGKCYKKPGN